MSHHLHVLRPQGRIHRVLVEVVAGGLKVRAWRVSRKVLSLCCEGRQWPDELPRTSNIRVKG